LEPLGDVRGDNDDTGDARLRAAGLRPDGHEGLDEVPGRQLADGRDLLAGEPALELALVHVAGLEVAEHGVLDVYELLPLRVEDGERADPELLLMLDQVCRESLAQEHAEEPVAVVTASVVR